jgi:hypothetical protein
MKRSSIVLIVLAAAAARCGSSAGNPTIPPASGSQGTVVVEVANEGWVHVPEGSVVRYASNPPASGPHYPVWGRYEELTAPLPRPYWVHNLEHGAIVFLYRPDTPAATVDALRSVFRSLPPDVVCGHSLALMTPDPELPRPIAVMAADWALTADGVDAATIRGFVTARRNRGPEKVCAGGDRP